MNKIKKLYKVIQQFKIGKTTDKFRSEVWN